MLKTAEWDSYVYLFLQKVTIFNLLFKTIVYSISYSAQLINHNKIYLFFFNRFWIMITFTFIFTYSYIGVQNSRWVSNFMRSYLREINTRRIASIHGNVCAGRNSGVHGVPPFKRLTTFVFITQLDWNVDHFTFRNTGNYSSNNILKCIYVVRVWSVIPGC